MLTRQRKTKEPCPGCRLHQAHCICDLIPKLTLKTRVCLVVHYKELKRTTNTGQLAIQSLINSEMRVRGEHGKPALDLTDLLSEEYRTVLFFPSEDAVELDDNFIRQSSKPLQLIVPDGNWRQASKVHGRHPELKNLPRVKISKPNLASQHLRAEHFAEGMSTLQAIAQALGAIEGQAAVEPLEKLYQAKLAKTLLGRGQKVPHELKKS